MPVGGEHGAQRLVRLEREAADRFRETDLGGVMFVPLVGAQGWRADCETAPDAAARRRALGGAAGVNPSLDSSDTLTRQRDAAFPTLTLPTASRSTA